MLVGCGQSSEEAAQKAKDEAARAAEATKEAAKATKEAAAATAEIVCSYAPSQSVIVSQLSGAAGGSAAAAAGVAKAAGLSVVMHSSGAPIFTGPAGYLAGTLGTAITLPVVVGVGVVVGGGAVTLELLCAPTNHPGFAAKIDTAATEFWKRSKTVGARTREFVAPKVTKVTNSVITAGSDAFSYAHRKSVEAYGRVKN
jgi:hypothetical protein